MGGPASGDSCGHDQSSVAHTPALPEKTGPLLKDTDTKPHSDDGVPETGPRAANAPLARQEAARPRALRRPMSPRRRLAVAILYPLAGTCCNEASLESKAKELNATVVPLDGEMSPLTDMAEEHQWGPDILENLRRRVPSIPQLTSVQDVQQSSPPWQRSDVGWTRRPQALER